MITSVYVHIPFCKNICSYCDFCKNYYNEKIVYKYIDSLKKEIDEKYKNEKLKTLYIGGGTPSCLSNNDLIKLFKVLNKFKLDQDYEYTFECNYEDINDEFLKILKSNGVNRLSIGIQTFNEKYKDILGRNINKKEMLKAIFLCKKYFDNINVDLIYALPNQKLKDLKKDLETFVNLDISHISTYCLIIEDNTKLKINNTLSLDDDIQNDMYYEIIDYLSNNGYEQYEISNFSKKNFESKHNLNYWDNNNYYGFGAGASGFIKNIRYENTKSIYNYINNTNNVNEENLSKETLIKDEIMLNLRKVSGINLEKFYKKYNKNLEKVFDINNLIDLKLLVRKDNYIYITRDKLFISNEIILKLIDTYLND